MSNRASSTRAIVGIVSFCPYRSVGTTHGTRSTVINLILTVIDVVNGNQYSETSLILCFLIDPYEYLTSFKPTFFSLVNLTNNNTNTSALSGMYDDYIVGNTNVSQSHIIAR